MKRNRKTYLCCRAVKRLRWMTRVGGSCTKRWVVFASQDLRQTPHEYLSSPASRRRGRAKRSRHQANECRATCSSRLNDQSSGTDACKPPSSPWWPEDGDSSRPTHRLTSMKSSRHDDAVSHSKHRVLASKRPPNTSRTEVPSSEKDAQHPLRLSSADFSTRALISWSSSTNTPARSPEDQLLTSRKPRTEWKSSWTSCCWCATNIGQIRLSWEKKQSWSQQIYKHTEH